MKRAAKVSMFHTLTYLWRLADHRAAGRKGIFGRSALRTAKGRRERVKEWQEEMQFERVRDAYPSVDPYEPYDKDSELMAHDLEQAFNSGRLPDWIFESKPVNESADSKENDPFNILMRRFTTLRNSETGKRLSRLIQRWVRNSRQSLTLILKLLERGAFRLFLRKKVRKLARRVRERVPRPPDLLPLPPSAPLAPPA